MIASIAWWFLRSTAGRLSLSVIAVCFMLMGSYWKGRYDCAEINAITRLQEEVAGLERQIAFERSAREKDAARADANQQALDDFKKKATEHVKALKNPGAKCFDRDDTKRLQRVFQSR